MYDREGSDDGLEWIEVYNEADVSVDLTQYKLFEADTNHKIVSYSGGTSLNPKIYGIISNNPQKFLSAWPSFSGVIFKSSFTLNNTGEKLALKDESLNIVHEYTYSSGVGGAGDGSTLQRIDSKWVSGKPTPGGENKLEIKKVVKVAENVAPKKVTAQPKNEPSAEIPEVEKSLSSELVALPIQSVTLEKEESKSSYVYFSIIGLVLVVLGGVFSVSSIRKKKVVLDSVDDFEILEE